jgi:hypothetical protein
MFLLEFSFMVIDTKVAFGKAYKDFVPNCCAPPIEQDLKKHSTRFPNTFFCLFTLFSNIYDKFYGLAFLFHHRKIYVFGSISIFGRFPIFCLLSASMSCFLYLCLSSLFLASQFVNSCAFSFIQLFHHHHRRACKKSALNLPASPARFLSYVIGRPALMSQMGRS